MKHVESFVANSGDHGDEVRFHAQTHNPRHHRNGKHSSANGNGRRSETNALPIEWLRDEIIADDQSQSCYHNDDDSQ